MAIYLKNEFNVTAANFIKNLVFVGGPRAKHSVISKLFDFVLSIYDALL